MLLNCHTCYSFRYGTYSIEELLDEVGQKGYDAFALTDINNTSACLEAIRLSKGKNVRVIAGIDFRNGIRQQYVGIAIDNSGFMELNEHLSFHLHRAIDFDAIAPDFTNAFIIYPLAGYKGWKLRANEYVGVSIRDIRQLAFSSRSLPEHKLVALQEVSFASGRQYNMHRLLRAIDANTLLSKLRPEEQASGNEMMPHRSRMLEAYASHPRIISNTHALLASCTIDFVYGKLAGKNLKHYTADAAGDMHLLRKSCEEGLAYRYPNPSPAVSERIEKELRVIAQLNFSSYYLINMDIVRYARHKNYYYVGRGSGANSIVAYLLRITDVDPIELDLYFERFINLYRNNAPDFDIDFSWTDRDDIIRYIFERFGHRRTALLGAYNTFRRDAVIRELGKVFGLHPGKISRLQEDETSAVEDKLDKLVLKFSGFLYKLPSHLSIHSSGVIISEEPVTAYTATSMPPKGYPTTQFSMMEAEDVGLNKFDILSQRGLAKIKSALEMIRENKGADIDIHRVSDFKADERVRSLLRKGNAIGCFYIESPAMRMLLAKLRADDYLRLVAASSIIRPGVAKSGMMREYILRYRNEAARDTARSRLPEFYDLLEETYGVMVYQEDVIKVAHFFAGLSLEEADYLRRGMSWKFRERNEFHRVRESFISNCLAKGYAGKLVLDIWNQIESFANYAFSKGHSASYAVESYQALYLKAYYPIEYLTATLNNGGGFYSKELYIHEARLHGAVIELPCVNNSEVMCTARGRVIYLGIGMISELESEAAAQIVSERRRGGPYADMHHFTERLSLSIVQLRLLIRAGAFGFTGKNKKQLLWEAHALVRSPEKTKPGPELFEVKAKTFKLPLLCDSKAENALDEIESFGFSLTSPFDLLRQPLPDGLKASEIGAWKNSRVTIHGYLVTVKRVETSRGEKMCFGTFTDKEGDWIDTVHFPPSLKQYPFTGRGCYVITGKVTEEFDFLSIEVESMKRLDVIDMEMAWDQATVTDRMVKSEK